MFKSFTISSTGFKGDAPAGAKADFRHSIRSLNVSIVPSLLNVSCSVKRGQTSYAMVTLRKKGG